MAQQSRKDKNAWDRFMNYVHENQKVLWVILLIVIAPSFAMTNLFTNFMGPSPDQRVVRTVAGKRITGAEFLRTKDSIDHVRAILSRARLADFSGLYGVLGDATFSLGSLDPVDYFLYREEARKRGITVSDGELAEYIRDIWQRCEAVTRAQREIEQKASPPAQDQNALFQRQIEIMSTGKKKLDDLRSGDGKGFDQESWVALIEGREGKSRRIIVRDFEETLRDMIVIAKLESFVKSTAKVTPQEAFERYNKENQERKVSWVEFKAPEALREKVKAGLTQDDIKNHYELTKDSLKKGVSLKTSWLLLPKDHFKAQAEQSATDEELKKYYEDNRNEYKKSTILAAEASFAVRTPAETEALRKELYKPFEDVKDKVREKFIEQRTKSEMQLLASQLATRIFPPKAPGSPPGMPDKPGASFEELAKEYPFLKTGSSAFFTRDEEKAALGDGYSAEVDRWWSSAMQGKPVISPRRALEAEGGQVFYSKVEARPGNYLGLLKDVEKEVRDSLATKKVLDALKVAADASVKEVNDGKKDLLALASAGVDVEIAGEKVHVAGTAVEGAAEFTRKQGSLMVPKKDAKGEKKDEKAKKKDADLDEEDREPDREVHPASKEILEAAYKLEEKEKGKTAVALEPKTSACYVVRLDEVKLPNPARFEEHRNTVEGEVLREKEQSAFVQWRNSLNAEAAAN